MKSRLVLKRWEKMTIPQWRIQDSNSRPYLQLTQESNNYRTKQKRCEMAETLRTVAEREEEEWSRLWNSYNHKGVQLKNRIQFVKGKSEQGVSMDTLEHSVGSPLTIPLHCCLGFVLTLRFYNTRYLETLASCRIHRKTPNLDKKLYKMPWKLLIALDQEQMLREQFAKFHMKNGLYSLPLTQMDAVTMEAIDLWSTYGGRQTCICSCLSLRFSKAYKEGPKQKYMDPKSINLEGLNSRLDDMEWEDLEEDEDNDDDQRKNQKVD
uniref:Uncharacterized protein n=1 Tax=Lactuca sativa TaxID=4236 RepID=A0A9R1VUI0_LACSA|nr:hypothetical protein LSAT_V11C400195680 [Lactuca sativa]